MDDSSKAQSTHERPIWRNVALLLGFVLIVAVGVVTVLIPELEDEPEQEQPPMQQAAQPEAPAGD